MKTKEFLALLDEMLELDPGTLTGSEPLADVPEWDSLAVISFIALVDERFDLILEGEKLAEAKTVRDLIDLLGGRVTD